MSFDPSIVRQAHYSGLRTRLLKILLNPPLQKEEIDEGLSF